MHHFERFLLRLFFHILSSIHPVMPASNRLYLFNVTHPAILASTHRWCRRLCAVLVVTRGRYVIFSFVGKVLGLWNHREPLAGISMESSLEEGSQFHALLCYVPLIGARAKPLILQRGGSLTRAPNVINPRTRMRLSEFESLTIIFGALLRTITIDPPLVLCNPNRTTSWHGFATVVRVFSSFF